MKRFVRFLPYIVILVALVAIPFIFGDDFVGEPAPKIQVEKWISEKPELDDKFVVIDFWATWCGPCIRSIPHLNALSEELGDDFAFVALSNEDEATVRGLKRATIEYYSAIDTQARLMRHFEINSIPHAVVIDPAGKVAWKGHPGYLDAQLLRGLAE